MAPEKFANLAETTLASSYTSGTTTLSVVSASGFPTVGVFRVRLGNAGKTIWRVDSVSGTTFTGAAEANDANATSGDAVKIVASKAVAERFVQSPESGEARLISGVSAADFYGPSHKLTALDQSGWAWVNQGGFSVTQASGIVYLAGPGSGAGNNVKLRSVAAPSTPYTITASVITFTGTGFSFVGIALRHNSSGRFIHIVPAQDRSIAVNRQNTATSFASTAVTRASAHGGGHLLFLRMRDDGTNVIFSYSSDGVNYTQLHSEARTSFINTPDHVAISAGHEGTGPGDGGGSILSWVQS
jgi:hypothetical protein